MKKVTIITNFRGVAEHHKMILQQLFPLVEISALGFDKDVIRKKIDADVLLISLYSIYVEIKEKIPLKAKVIVLSTTLTKEQRNKINSIREGSEVLLVNYSPEMTLESMALLRQIGLTNYNFFPVYPGKKDIPPLPIAVTLGEREAVPDFVEKIIDTGHRTLDETTIMDVAVSLEMEHLLQSPPFITHFNSLCKVSTIASALLDRLNMADSRFLKLLNVIDEGIITTDPEGVILGLNDKAHQILSFRQEIIGKNLLEVLDFSVVKEAIQSKAIVEQELIRFQHTNISFRSAPVMTGGMISSIIIVINQFEEKEKFQHQLRAKILGKGHKAKYTFDSIIGESEAIQKTRTTAQKIARSNSSVLITGETGTGKELFAQAIHNASRRKNYQFVAVNCASIPEPLLESELFGYEEGAFTGAKKGGRIGLFELAHQGTLFLDEIGEVSTHLQSRLLRVIQEKEVMRVGGDRVIPVDARIITATNQDLRRLIQENKFRKDLYYRINVLSLKIPPLRERRTDIMLGFEYIQKEIHAGFTLTEEAKNYLSQYPWEGNFRELQNCVEYLAYLEKDLIHLQDLKESLPDVSFHFPLKEEPPESNLMPEEGFVFRCLLQAREEMKGLGRRRMMEMAKEQKIYLSERTLRNTLQTFQEKGWVEVEKGRKGTLLTEKGFQAFKRYYDQKQ
ncbi:Transcriptional regulator containing PAS, AAA-type ATPase, and DNA-binding Fis domains [Tindallia magadiensis]|uniref:Transcriptional regulator containing PAS, AAA-type ATPase, and DNA-binding Fis domains n=1 Tax=Tindallia magadiensis TaxID=69895 RepID=A0A1I3EPM3_9FIRM|nr:sigma 54-interacting transcriptional regulator [Tindallia magadiensis]SFI00934.1 Transcriptional regulator containing PAS, AAA-type ATPase, and DNA-binding Fis domains [Tindallia magadiensis]